ncbi:MAG: 2,3-bisphosphoglycerate-independent phosphoglycerate mutase [Candidatus Latescibacteria bacterium]|nr:2,3-bisphosphoglycerate-independent phosphoglycerate mutase [Candidatus Latescibacterota bacterium]
MISSQYTRDLWVADSDSKILMLVIDGLGGLPHPDFGGESELERARLPNLDRLASGGSCGLISPLGPGFTPGSGPAHLALFGYDPWKDVIGRGALSALGLGLDFKAGDVAARLNFCSVDADFNVTDRRAGRIPTPECQRLCQLLGAIDIPGVEVRIAPEMEYRAGVVFRGDGLADAVTDSDPQVTGVPPLALEARTPEAARMVEVAEEFLRQVRALLAAEQPANMVLIRGFGRYPELAPMQEVYGLRPLAVAGYPMYRGVARTVGMDAAETGWNLASECQALQKHWDEYDFFYVHVKKTDSAGEDGDFAKKVELLEEVDQYLPQLEALGPDVLIVTGDHSTPARMQGHSWHPVPLAIASEWAMADGVPAFSERGCRQGSLGVIPSTALMALGLAHARRLAKFGA